MDHYLKKKRLVLSFCIAVFVILAFSCVLFTTQGAKAEVNYNTPEIQSEYALNGVFTIPDVSFNINGETYSAQSSLRFPSGEIYTNRSVLLNEEGTYILTYQTTVSDELYRNDLTFSVKADYRDLFDITKNVDMRYGKSTVWEEGQNVSGLMVEMLGNDTVSYTRNLDLGSVTKDDVILELAAVPPEVGKQDFSEFIIKFTDAENEDIFFTARVYDHFNGSGDHNGAYIAPSWRGISTIPYGGSAMKFSFAGLNKFKTLRFYYDNTSSSLYSSVNFYNGKETLVFSLADKPEWAEVKEMKISISVAGVTSRAKYIISSIGGVDFSENTAKDVKEPMITVDDLSDKVVAEVGKPFKIFGFTAVDNYSYADCYQTVTYSQGGGELKIDENGYFIPDRAGRFYINYYATDAAGNTAEKNFGIAVQSNLAPLDIAVTDDGVNSYFVGEKIRVREHICSGGAGNNVETITVINTTNSKTYAVSPRGFFSPSEAGNYTVTYKAVDYLGNKKEVSYSLTVTVSDKVFVADDPVLPPAFINGTTYDLTGIIGYDYVSEVSVTPEIYVKANGTETKLENGKFAPKDYADGTQVEIIYRFGQGTKAVEKKFTKTVLNVQQGAGFMTRYFIGDGISSVANKNNVSVTLSQDGSRFSFANKVGASWLNLIFGANTDGDVTVKLCDSKNENQVVELRILSDNTVTVNGGDTYSLIYTVADSGEKGFNINFDGKAFSGAFDCLVTNYLNGDSFNGFESGYVYIEFAFENSGTMYIYTINNQAFSNASADFGSPIIEVSKSSDGIIDLNESTVTVYSATAYDILNDIAELTVSVMDLYGNICKSVDGQDMYMVSASTDYSLRFSEAKDYSVTYYARDNAGRSSTLVRSLKVLNSASKPEIDIPVTIKSNYAVGDTLSLPMSTKVPSGAHQYIYVVHCGYYTEVTYEGTYKFEEAGIYKIVYFVVDENDNFNYKEAKVLVR